MVKKNNDKPYWLEAQKSTKTYFYDTLNSITPKWKKDAFMEIYDGDMSNYEIAEKYKKSHEYISRWKHSREYEELCLMWSRVKYLSLLPKAIKTVEEMLEKGAEMTKTREGKIRYKIACDIIERAEIFKVATRGGNEKSGDKYQFNFFGIEEVPQEKIRDEIKKTQDRILEISGSKK